MQLFVEKRVSEWKFFFFSGAVFFFPALWNRVSEWRVNFSWKKKTEFWSRFLGKKTTKKTEIRQKVPFFTVFDLFLEVDRLSAEWVACKLFLEKKNSLIFFFQNTEKKNKKCPKWVSEYPQIFSAEKKIRYLWSHLWTLRW